MAQFVYQDRNICGRNPSGQEDPSSHRGQHAADERMTYPKEDADLDRNGEQTKVEIE
jgi:hypothetical protein